MRADRDQSYDQTEDMCRSGSIQGRGKARNSRGAARPTAANPTAKRFRSTSVLFTDGSVPISSRISYDLRLK